MQIAVTGVNLPLNTFSLNLMYVLYKTNFKD